jgi:hypothetical protein
MQWVFPYEHCALNLGAARVPFADIARSGGWNASALAQNYTPSMSIDALLAGGGWNMRLDKSCAYWHPRFLLKPSERLLGMVLDFQHFKARANLVRVLLVMILFDATHAIPCP